MPPHPVTNFEIKENYQMNLNLIAFIPEVICGK